MKLNLLPQYVSKGAAARTWMILSILASILSIAAAIGLITISGKNRNEAESAMNDKVPQAQQVVALAKSAETVAATSAMTVRNIALAKAMEEHPAKIGNFYRDVIPYIPSFFRINAMTMTPVDATTCTLTLTGTIQTYQQYADLMLALLRIPGAQNVSRAGFVLDRKFLPGVSEEMPYPEMRKGSESALPLDPRERIAALVARASQEPTGFTGAGNYAGPIENPRQAIPKWQNITVSVVLKTPGVQVPVPGQTGAPGAGPAAGPSPSLNPGATQPPAAAANPAAGAPGAGAPAGPDYNFLVPIPKESLPGGGATGAPAGGGPAGTPAMRPGMPGREEA